MDLMLIWMNHLLMTIPTINRGNRMTDENRVDQGVNTVEMITQTRKELTSSPRVEITDSKRAILGTITSKEAMGEITILGTLIEKMHCIEGMMMLEEMEGGTISKDILRIQEEPEVHKDPMKRAERMGSRLPMNSRTETPQ